MARQTIPDEQTFAEFTVVSPTTVFPISFALLQGKVDLTVLVDGVALSQSAYSFNGTVLDGGGFSGGTVTLNTTVDDCVLRIERNVAIVRTSNFAPSNSVPVGAVDLALNRLTAVQQDQERRKLDIPAGDRAGKYVVFDANGNPTTSSGTGADDGLRTDLATAGGDSLVSFLQSGIGASDRTVRGKLREIRTPEDYNAVGDGVADDTAELQALLDASAGGVATLPKPNAVYRTTDGLVVPANTLIDGQGSTIFAEKQGETDALLFTDGGGARDLALEGPYPGGGTYESYNNGIACRGTTDPTVGPTYVKAPKLENVTVNGFGYAGVLFRYCIDESSANLAVTNCGYVGVEGLSSRNVWIRGYRADTIGPGQTGDAYGVFFDRDESGSLITDPPSYRCGATGVNISNVRANGNGQGVDSHAGIEIYYEGIVNDCDVAGAFTGSNVNGAALIAPKRCRARITGTSDHQGYGFFVVGALAGGNIVDYAEDCELELNLTGYGKDVADGSIGATDFYGTKGLRLRGSFKNPRSCGVRLNRDNYGYDIDVTVTDPHSNSFGAPASFRVISNNNKGRFAGGHRHENPALATNVAVASTRIEGSLTGLDIDFGPSHFEGLTSSHLGMQLGTTAGVRHHGQQSQSGSSSLSAVSAGTEAFLDVTFPKRFPYPPSVQITPGWPANGGGKTANLVLREDSVTETGFRVYAYPADGGAWTATGSIPFRWAAD